MTLANACRVLDDIAGGRVPDRSQAIRGLYALDPLVGSGDCEKALLDAACTLELLVASGGAASFLRARRREAAALAAAVRRAMDQN